MNSLRTQPASLSPSAQTTSRAGVRIAELGVFVLTALVVSMPSGLLPFGLCLLLGSLIGWRSLRDGIAAREWSLRVVGWLTVGVIAMSLLSIALFEHGLRDVGNRSRFLVLPGGAMGLCIAAAPALAVAWRASRRVRGDVDCIVAGDERRRPRGRLHQRDCVCRHCADVAGGGGVLSPARQCALASGRCGRHGGGDRAQWQPRGLVGIAGDAGRADLGRAVAQHAHALLTFIGSAVLAMGVVLSVPGLTDQMRLGELQSDLQRYEVGDSDSSAGARIERLHVAWDTVTAHPLTGVGVGRFDDAMQDLPACAADPALVRCHLGHAHNDLAEWGATQGVPGLLLLLAVYGVPLWLFVRLHRCSGQKQFRGPAAAGVMIVISYALCGLTQSMFAHQVAASFYTATLGVLVGLSARQAQQTELAATSAR